MWIGCNFKFYSECHKICPQAQLNASTSLLAIHVSFVYLVELIPIMNESEPLSPPRHDKMNFLFCLPHTLNPQRFFSRLPLPSISHRISWLRQVGFAKQRNDDFVLHGWRLSSHELYNTIFYVCTFLLISHNFIQF